MLKEGADESEIKNLVDSLQTSGNLEFIRDLKYKHLTPKLPGFLGT